MRMRKTNPKRTLNEPPKTTLSGITNLPFFSTDQVLARACEGVSRSRVIGALEREWDVLTGEIEEPWQ